MTDLLEEFIGNVHSLHVKSNGKIKKNTVRIKNYSWPFFNKIILEEQKKKKRLDSNNIIQNIFDMKCRHFTAQTRKENISLLY